MKKLATQNSEEELFERELRLFDREVRHEDRAMRREERNVAKEVLNLNEYNWFGGSEYTAGTSYNSNFDYTRTYYGRGDSRPSSSGLVRPQSGYSINSENIKEEVMMMADEHEKIKDAKIYGNIAATEIQKMIRGWNVRKQPMLKKMKEWYGVESSIGSSRIEEEELAALDQDANEYDAFIYGSFAATEIQKVVRGWNVRKQPTLLKMKEWYGVESSIGSSNNTPRDL